MNEGRIQRECVDCRKPFSISPNEAAWLKERKLELFKRCKACRTKRKAANQDSSRERLREEI